MIALFCRLYKTKRMQHMSCILLFCIYIPHYSNYLSIFIRYTPTQTEGHIPCLRHQQLYFSDSPVLFPALHLDSLAGTLLQLHLLWGPHRRILSDLHSFRLRLHILLNRQDTTANLWDSRFHQDQLLPRRLLLPRQPDIPGIQKVSGSSGFRLQPVSGLRFRWHTELLHGGGSNLYSVSNSY